MEQIAVGGMRTVRGYRENQMVRDNALISSLELRIPLLRTALGAEPARGDVLLARPLLELVQPFLGLGDALLQILRLGRLAGVPRYESIIAQGVARKVVGVLGQLDL